MPGDLTVEWGEGDGSPVDVLLAQLAWEDDGGTVSGGAQAPMGLAFLAAALRRRSVRVSFGLLQDGDSIERLLRRFRPKVLGLGATGNEIDRLLDRAEAARRHSPELSIIAGGYCSGEPERLLGDSAVDAVVMGEGEATIVELVPRLLAGAPIDGVPGLAIRGSGDAVVRTAARPAIADLDGLAMPAYTHDPPDSGMIRVYSSRGCPYECTFCRIKDYYATPRVRYHGADYVRRWIRSLLDRSAGTVRVVYFNDDEFLLSPRHFERMAGVVRELGLTLCFQTRTDDILRHANRVEQHADVIHQVHLGVESFSPSQLTRWRKSCAPDTNLRALQILADLGCSYYPYVILTDPYTTPSEIEETVSALVALPPCSLRGATRRTNDRGKLSPLHAGLHLNRMKSFLGHLERRPETEYLEAVWCFLGRTQAAADRMASLCRDSVRNREVATNVPRAAWAAGARWLERRLLELPKLAERAASASNLQHGLQLAEDLAARFCVSAEGHALEYLAARVLGRQQLVRERGFPVAQ